MYFPVSCTRSLGRFPAHCSASPSSFPAPSDSRRLRQPKAGAPSSSAFATSTCRSALIFSSSFCGPAKHGPIFSGGSFPQASSFFISTLVRASRSFQVFDSIIPVKPPT